MKHLWTVLLLISTTLSCPDLDEYCAQCSGKGHSQCKLCYGSYLLEGECVSVARKHQLCQVRNSDFNILGFWPSVLENRLYRILSWLSQVIIRQCYGFSIVLQGILILVYSSAEILWKKEHFNIYIDIFISYRRERATSHIVWFCLGFLLLKIV